MMASNVSRLSFNGASRGFSPLLRRQTLQKTTNGFVRFSSGEDQIRKGTEAWVKDVVVKHGLCPFAAKSNYQIIVNTSDNYQDMQDLFLLYAQKLAAEPSAAGPHHYPNYIFVYPQLLTADKFGLFYQDAVKSANGLVRCWRTTSQLRQTWQCKPYPLWTPTRSGCSSWHLGVRYSC